MTFWETIERGEYVMFALAVLFIVSLCIWWVKYLRFRIPVKNYNQLMFRVKDFLAESDLENASEVCVASGSPYGRVIGDGVREIGSPIREVAASMKSRAEFEELSFTKGERWLRFIAAASPIIGLGGTLCGVIDRLRDLGDSGSFVDISTVCANIAPTIVTTVAGLATGVLALLALTSIDASVSKYKVFLNRIIFEFTEFLNERN